MLCKQQFDVLNYIHKNREYKLTQMEISKSLKMSIGSLNKIIAGFRENGYIASVNKKMEVTEKAYDVLEHFRVKRAIILAAGFSQRMMPLSLYTPTALLIAKGKRLIETVIDALLEKNIKEIYIVRGFLGEAFNVLLSKYPMIKLIENDDFKETLSVSSCYAARDFLENAYILHSDIYIASDNVINEYEYGPNYLGKYKQQTNDWNYEVDKGIITGIKQGGTDCYLMYGITYLDRESGIILKELLEKNYGSPGFKEKMLDGILLDCYNGHIKFSVRECCDDDIFEFDSLRELQEFDSLYKY